MPNDTLDDLHLRKKELSRHYLGRYGIHGIGLRRREDCIYVITSKGLDETVVRKMEGEVRPHRLQIYDGPRFRIH
jgi:hypothetical protein